MAYCTQNDIERIYGALSVHRWANLDGDDDGYAIADRIAWAIEMADEVINSRLQRTRYEIPFITVPRLITYVASLHAGLFLHDGRQVVSGEKSTEMSLMRKTAGRMMGQIQNGQLKLLNPTTQEELSLLLKNQAPFSITTKDDDDDTPLVYEG